MASTVRTPPPAPGDEPTLEEARQTGWYRVGRIAVVLTAIAIALMWIYAFFGDHPVPGRMADRTFPAAAQPICAAAKGRLDALPKAFQSPDPVVRAGVIDDSAAIFDGMIGELRAANPSDLAEHGRINEWLGDWERYNADRRDYARRLRADAGARFYVTQSERDKAQITKAMDNFATVNGMAACTVPEDLG